jgi:hypothetical protein
MYKCELKKSFQRLQLGRLEDLGSLRTLLALGLCLI